MNTSSSTHLTDGLRQDTYSYDASNSSGSDTRVPFPPGFTMIAGNPYQRLVNKSDPAYACFQFQCMRASGNSPYSVDMRDFQREGLNCDETFRATIDFPACWDGVVDTENLADSVSNLHILRFSADLRQYSPTSPMLPKASLTDTRFAPSLILMP